MSDEKLRTCPRCHCGTDIFLGSCIVCHDIPEGVAHLLLNLSDATKDLQAKLAAADARARTLEFSLREYMEELPEDHCPDPNCGGQCALFRRAKGSIEGDFRLKYISPSAHEFEVAHLRQFLNQANARARSAEAERDETLSKIKRDKMHRDNAVRCEREACKRTLLCLAGAHVCTPEEGYGTNVDWAINDLCLAVKALRADLDRYEQAFEDLRIADQATLAETLAAALEQSLRAEKAEAERDAAMDHYENMAKQRDAAIELAAWKPITPETKFDVNKCYEISQVANKRPWYQILWGEDYQREYASQQLLNFGRTHYRAINAPSIVAQEAQ